MLAPTSLNMVRSLLAVTLTAYLKGPPSALLPTLLPVRPILHLASNGMWYGNVSPHRHVQPSVFPSIVGRPILRAEERVGATGGLVIKDIMIGDEAAEARNFLQVTQPMEHGIVRNWEDMKHLWDYTFQEKLRVDPAGRKILLTEPPMNPKVNRQRMCQVMFEEYGFQGVYVAIQAVLTLYAQGACYFSLHSLFIVCCVIHIAALLLYSSTLLAWYSAGRSVARVRPSFRPVVPPGWVPPDIYCASIRCGRCIRGYARPVPRRAREERRGTCIWVDRVTRSNRFFPHDRPGNTWPCSDRRCRPALPHNISSRRHTFLLRLQSTQLISASISRFRFSHIRVEKNECSLIALSCFSPFLSFLSIAFAFFLLFLSLCCLQSSLALTLTCFF